MSNRSELETLRAFALSRQSEFADWLIDSPTVEPVSEYSDEEIGGLGSGTRYPVGAPDCRYAAHDRALDLAVVLGIHELSAAFIYLERELRIIQRIDELTADRVHLGPTTLARVRTVIEARDPR